MVRGERRGKDGDGRRGGFNVTVTKADGSSLNQFGEAGTRSR